MSASSATRLSSVENPIAGAFGRQLDGEVERPSRDRQRDTSSSGRLASVEVVQTSDQGQSDNLAIFRRLVGTRLGTILIQSSMSVVAMVILELFGQHPLQVSSMEHDHVVQALAPDGADQTLNERILRG